MRSLVIAAASAALLGFSSGSANAALLYGTSFEAPAFSVGTSASGIEGFANGSGTGVSQTVSNARALNGAQSLRFDNSTTNNSFYSVNHLTGQSLPTSGVSLSVSLWMDGTNGADRTYEIDFTNSPTGTLGSTIVGLSIGGNGAIRAGTTWAPLFSTASLATAPAGTFSDRWLTMTLTYDGAGGGVASILGFGGAIPSYTFSFTGVSTPANFNLGTDYITNTARSGVGYYDDLLVSQFGNVPEPTTMAGMFFFGGSVLVYRRRRAD